MIFICILLLLLGGVFIWMGLLIWKKEKIELIHDYHYDKMSEENKKPFCKMMGQALVLIGAGIAAMGIIFYFADPTWGSLIFAVCLAAGIIMCIEAVRKYNR